MQDVMTLFQVCNYLPVPVTFHSQCAKERVKYEPLWQSGIDKCLESQRL